MVMYKKVGGLSTPWHSLAHTQPGPFTGLTHFIRFDSVIPNCILMGKCDEFYVTYTVNVGGSPGASNGGYKRLQIQNILPNCTSDPRPMGYIEASFDNVMVNESAVL